MTDSEATQPVPATDEPFFALGRWYRPLAAFPLGSGNGYRVPARLLRDDAGEPLTEPPDPSPDSAHGAPLPPSPHEDPVRDTHTLVFPHDSPPVLLEHPVDWTSVSPPYGPLAVELCPGDTLPPARGVPGRPSVHLENPPPLSTQVVTSTVWREWDGLVQVTTRDSTGQTRNWRRMPEETVRFDRPYVRPPRVRPAHVTARHPERFDGPFVSPTGAQFVVQERSRRGGRLPRDTPQYDPTLPPRFDPHTNELMPYVVIGPPARQALSGAVLRAPTMFTPSARRLPEVQAILREHGLLPPAPEPEAEAAT